MITVLTAHNDKIQQLANITTPVLEKYCNQNNYQLVVKHISNDFDKHPAWYKPIAILDTLEETGCDYLFWIDTDALVIKPTYKLEDIIEEDKYLYISHDFNCLNSGVMLLKNCDLIKDFFREVYARYPSFKDHGWWEQAAIIQLVEQNYQDIRRYIKQMPQHIFNAYEPALMWEATNHSRNEESFVVHLAGVANDIRMYFLQEYMKMFYS